MLEGLLEEQGLTVPPASHPPESRHRSRQSKETSSVNDTPLSSSTPQDGSICESHTTSSPYSSDDQTKEKHPVTTTRKRSSIHIEIDTARAHFDKRSRHDSLITPADVKPESPIQKGTSKVTHLSGPYELDQFAKLPPPDSVPLWPTAHEHTGAQTMIYSTLQTTRIDNCAYSAWSDRTFDFQSYNHYSLGTQHEDPLNTEHQYAGISPAGKSTTNLDFMSLSTGS